MSSILRKRLSGHWTGIPNNTIRDRNIGFKATGVLVFLLSMDDGWSMDAREIAKQKGGEGRTAILSAVKELRAAGYMRYIRQSLDGGLWATEVEVSDSPNPAWIDGAGDVGPEAPKLLTGVRPPDAGSSDAGSSDAGSSDAGSSDPQGKTSPKDLVEEKHLEKDLGRRPPSATVRAQALVREWWDMRKARGDPPAQTFLVVQNVVAKALRNGVAEDDLRWALPECPSISGASIDVALARRKEKSRGNGTLAQIEKMHFDEYERMIE